MENTKDEVRISIRGIAVGGAGVGEVLSQQGIDKELRGITAFVPFSVPGEQVLARVIKKRPRHIEAHLKNVEVSSNSRVNPPCKYFGECGGCDLQHISYQTQVRAKFEMIENALKAAKIDQEHIDRMLPVVLDKPLQYRRRVTLHLDKTGRVGFYRPASRSIVPIADCIVAVDSIRAVLKGIRNFGHEIQGLVSTIILEADESSVIAVLKSPYELNRKDVNKVLEIAKKHFDNAILYSDNKEVGGFGGSYLELSILANTRLRLRFPAGSFSQVNWGINQALVERACHYAEVKKGCKVFDLYAGAGNFSLPAASYGARVTAVEVEPRLVSFGKENANANGLGRSIDFRCQSVERFLESYSQSSESAPDVIFADPPRSGLGGVVKFLDDAKVLLLVSCHLPSMVRDTKALIERGWYVDTILPFDMFSQTSYLEILTVFKR